MPLPAKTNEKHQASPSGLLLLPHPPLRLTYSTLCAAYERPLRAALERLRSANVQSSLDVVLPLRIQDASDRAVHFDHVARLLAALYHLLDAIFDSDATWDERRSLTGAPLTNGTAVDILHAAGVKVAIGTSEDWETRNLFLMAGIVHKNSGGKISEKEALDMISTNIYDILGLDEAAISAIARDEFLIFEGNPLELQSAVRAVYDGSGKIHVWA